MEATADHGGEFVVRGAEIGHQEAPDVGGVALQGCMVLMETRGVMMVMRGYQRVQIFVVLLRWTAMVDRRTGLLGTGRAFVSGRAMLAGDSRSGRSRHRRRCRLMLMLLMLVGLSGHFLLLILKPLLASQVTTVLEHVAAVRVQGPEGSLAGFVRRARHLDEAVVEAERVPDGVLPALLILSVEREQIHDELIDLR